jgi:predicted lysophospholipase L1 biosynthesis ABC-type transport system permease subunit
LPGSGNNSEQSLEIIGDVRNGKYRSLTEDVQPVMYLPLMQNYRSEMALQARCAMDPKSMLSAVRNQINSLDSKLPVFDIKTLDEQKNRGIYSARLAAMLLSALDVLALFMVAVEIYGIMSYTVSQRTNEIGIRMALGSQRNDVLKLIMRNGIWLVVVGIVLGIAGAFATTRFITSFLYGISATDPNIFVIASLLLTMVTLLASYVPLRRGMKVDPIIRFFDNFVAELIRKNHSCRLGRTL